MYFVKKNVLYTARMYFEEMLPAGMYCSANKVVFCNMGCASPIIKHVKHLHPAISKCLMKSVFLCTFFAEVFDEECFLVSFFCTSIFCRSVSCAGVDRERCSRIQFCSV